ncbi:MAG TPA: fused MFS/spermidine synthase [Candidatus Saccharimonadales bacterium]|nr:fused MFS/spermidine synthase [Candidatus Saccharimonadales bacterium]
MHYECDTPFNHYVIEDLVYNGRPARVLYSGDKIAALSGIATDGKPEFLFDYNQTFFELIAGIKPANLLLLGGGAFTFPVAVNKQMPSVFMDIVEIDPKLLELGKRYFGFKTGPQVNVHIGDGLEYIEKTRNLYDCVIVDVFDDVNIPPSFQTDRFALNLRKHTAVDGLVAINVISSLRGLRSQSIRRVYDFLKEHFEVVEIFPATEGMSSWIPQNYVLVANSQNIDAKAILIRPDVKLPGFPWDKPLNNL